MDYTIWEDINGKEHEISDMSIYYLVNCIRFISTKRKELHSINESNDKGNATYDNIDQYRWCEEHADNYIIAFSNELKKRLTNIEIALDD